MKKILAIALLLASCSGMKKTADTPAPAVQDTALLVTDSITYKAKLDDELQNKERYRLVVSFYSKGSGPDSEAIELFLNMVQYFETNQGTKIDYNKTPWGREGEVDYCMKLLNLSAEQQSNFVLQIRETLLKSQLVHIGENTPCMHMR